MFRAIWFILKVALLTAAVAIVARHPGWINIDGWMGYDIQIDIRFAIFMLAAFLFIWTMGYRLWRGFVSVPAVFRRYRVAMNREKGYRSLTQGLVAIAAGDARAAEKYAKRAETLIPAVPLTKLLSAQNHLLQGNAPRARMAFQELLDDDDAAIFGIRGLLNETMAAGNYREALDYIRQADKLQPKRRWVLRSLLDLETRNHDWQKAQQTVRRAEKAGAIDKKEATSARQALLIALCDRAIDQADTRSAMKFAAEAFGNDRGYVPATERLARLYIKAGKPRAARKTLLKGWAAHPHPELAQLWMSLRIPSKKAQSIYEEGQSIYDWAQELCGQTPDHRDAHRALGMAAMEGRLWRQAREHLMAAQDYRALARLEHAETGNESKAREWLEQSIEHPQDPRWTCTACGHAAEDFTATCRYCGSFNSLEWMISAHETHNPTAHAVDHVQDLLTPPVSERA